MKSNKYDISTLITKFLNENISEKENAFLKDWLAENSSNQQFFDELVQTDKIQRGIKLLENIDYDKGWKAVITKQRKPRAKTLNYIYRAAAVILAVLAISFFFLDNTSDNKRVDRKSTRLNSSHVKISYAVFCLKKKKKTRIPPT